MALITQKVKGTEDILPKDSYKWQFVEDVLRKESTAYGFKEIRTPVFEHTELFCRSVGDTTDVVQKEMYTFVTKGDTSVTLRPEGTAGAARALLEHAVHNEGLPVKASYFVSCYRYEKAEKGRLREFHQFGMEVYGAASPVADAEIICAAQSIFNRLGIKNLQLELNSIGCPVCRTNYQNALKDYFKQYKSDLCSTCLSRLERNPMRILDCKSEVCSKIADKAPTVLEYLCDECKEHFEGVKARLDSVGIKYHINPAIVRGLDYYTKTVFEFVSSDLGSKSTVCGGGRYDGLIEEIGGPHLPSLGYAIGLERLLMIMEAQGIEIPKPPVCDLYIVGLGNKAQVKAFQLVELIRTASLMAESDIAGRGLKAQMKYANKIGAKFTMVIGEDEIINNKAKLRNMATGEEKEISIDDKFFNEFIDIYNSSFDDMFTSFNKN